MTRRSGLDVAVGLATVGACLLPALLWTGLHDAAAAPRLWTFFPGWTYQADGLSVAVATLGLLLAGLGLAELLPVFSGLPAPARLRAAGGWALLLLGLAQTTFAGNTLGLYLGLELAGLALWLLTPVSSNPQSAIRNPPTVSRFTPSAVLLRHLAGYPLLAVALSGLLDRHPAPGQPIPDLPLWVVGALLLSGLVRALSAGAQLAGAADRSLVYALLLYAPAAGLPLLHSLAGGPWDPWGRWLVAGAGLLLLAGAVLVALAPGRAWPRGLPLAGAVLLGLGAGSPLAVVGALAFGAAGLIGAALAWGATGAPGANAQALRAVGRLGALGLPPLAGFAGLWLLAGAVLPARYGLGLVLLLLLMGMRNAAETSAPPNPQPPTPNPQYVSRFTFHTPLIPLAALLLLGGLYPQGWLEGAVIPAVNALAAGVPALSGLRPVPGLGYFLGPEAQPVGLWPVVGVGVAVALAWLAVEIGAGLLGRRDTRDQGSGIRGQGESG